MRYLIGLDNGGTVIKAAVFDESGRQLSVASEKVSLITPKPGYTERDMEELWQANARAVRRAVEASGVDPADIAALGISGHGKGLYLLDREGKPLGNGIVSTDNRALSYEVEFTRSSVAERVRAVNHQNILACQPVCLLRWLKDNRPEEYARIGAVLSVKDYVRYRLTGEIYAERTDISGSNLLNLTTGRYDRDLLGWFGIEEVYGALPEVRDSAAGCGCVTEEAAALTGLRVGTVIAGGMFDIDACALAMGIVDERDICVIAGTWSINEFIRRAPAETAAMNSYYCIPGYYLIEECSPTSAGNLEWVLKTFFREEIDACGGMNAAFYSRLNESVAGVSPESNQVIFLPFLFASNEGPGYRGTFLNMTAATTKAEIAEAVYEGIVFSHRSHIDRLLRAKDKPGAVRLAGGAANSHVWCAMFADVLDQEIRTVSDREPGCFGAASAAGIAAGVYRDFEQAAERSVQFDKIYRPDPARVEIYRRKYAEYRRAVEALAGFYTIEKR